MKNKLFGCAIAILSILLIFVVKQDVEYFMIDHGMHNQTGILCFDYDGKGRCYDNDAIIEGIDVELRDETFEPMNYGSEEIYYI